MSQSRSPLETVCLRLLPADALVSRRGGFVRSAILRSAIGRSATGLSSSITGPSASGVGVVVRVLVRGGIVVLAVEDVVLLVVLVFELEVSGDVVIVEREVVESVAGSVRVAMGVELGRVSVWVVVVLGLARLVVLGVKISRS